MPIPLSCTCGAKMKAPDHLAGKSIKCPKCQSVIKIPGAAVPAGVGAASAAAPPRPAPGKAPATRPSGVKGAPAVATMKITSPIPPTEVPEHIASEAKREIEQGEKTLWIGQPVAKVLFLRRLWMSGVGLICIAVAVGSFLLLVMPLFSKPPDKGMEYIVILFPIVFGITGICMTYAPFWEFRRAGKTWYLMTNRRAIVHWQQFFGISHTEYVPEQLLGHFHKSAGMGVGDVVFKTDVTIHSTLYQTNTTDYTARKVEKSYRGFLAIRNAKQVADVLSEALVEPYEKAMGINQTGEMRGAKTAAGISVSGGNELDQLDEVNEKDAPAAPLPPEFADWSIPGNFEGKVQEELSRNEKVVWAGKPYLLLKITDALMFPTIAGLIAGLAYIGAFDWLFGLKGDSGKGIAALAGAYFAYGFTLKLFIHFMRTRSTCYVLTNKRALVWMGGLLWNSYNIYTPAELSEMRTRKSWYFPDAGDVIFYHETTVNTQSGRHGRRSISSVKTYYYGFMRVRHQKVLYQLVKDTLLKNVVFKRV